jgi:ferrochelatase
MNADAPTGIVLLNLGGPQTPQQVEPFLKKLFQDREIVQLPAQKWLGAYIAKRRAPAVAKKYEAIGGSPILKWTSAQGEAMTKRLDEISPRTAPHKFYVAFRYIDPTSEDALIQMKADGVSRAIAFTQYPQWSCSTTGSSLNEFWRAVRKLNVENDFKWSVIDRWHVHKGFIEAMTQKVREGLAQFEPKDRADVVLLFSAHSLPLNVIERGDAYPQEIGASVQGVVEKLNSSHEFILAYQSDVGPVKWLGPSTESMIRNLARQGRKNVLVVPIAFTSDHIETLHEIDIEYGELARELGITNFKRAPALNDDPIFITAMADIVADHLQKGELCSPQYPMRCPGCANEQCRTILNPALPDWHRNLETPFTPELYRAMKRGQFDAPQFEKESKTPEMIAKPLSTIKRSVLVVVGLIALVVGIIGAFTPGLPSTVFFIIALGCFTRSSDRLYRWTITRPWLQSSLAQVDNYKRTGAIPLRVKLIAMGCAWTSFAFIASGSTRAPWFVTWIVLALALACTAFMLSRKTA